MIVRKLLISYYGDGKSHVQKLQTLKIVLIILFSEDKTFINSPHSKDFEISFLKFFLPLKTTTQINISYNNESPPDPQSRPFLDPPNNQTALAFPIASTLVAAGKCVRIIELSFQS